LVINFIENQIIEKKVIFIGYIYDQLKCYRDISYVISAYANDIRFLSNKSTLEMAKGYWIDGTPQVRLFAEIVVHKFIKSTLVEIFLKNNINQSTIDHLVSLCDIIINVLEYGLNSLPKEKVTTNSLRHDIFLGTDRTGNGFANDLRNPQVLAPYLFVFSQRTLNEADINLNIEIKDPIKARNFSKNEIGLASMFTVFSATNLGLDTGFCACIRNGNQIGNRLGHNDPVLLYIGIGYSSKEKIYFNPVIHEYLSIPDSDYDVRPNLDTHYKFITP